jgi:hypothetical protein
LFRKLDPLGLGFVADPCNVDLVFLDSVCIQQSKESTSV